MSAVPARSGPRRGRKPTFSLHDVAEATLAVGFRDLTMNAVADRLGVKHSSLYRRVPSRDALVTAAMDLAVRRADWPEAGDDWRAYLESTADAVWGIFAAHPGMAEQIRDLERTPPAITHAFYATVRELTRFGFPPGLAVLAVDTVTDLAADVYVGWERLSGTRPGEARPGEVRPGEVRPGEARKEREERGPREEREAREVSTRRDLLREAWAGEDLAPDTAPFAEIVRDIIEGDPHDWFRAKLALFLDGVRARLDHS
ncbi:TetR/AcrR family transcriptional regulator [Streptosporangium sp. NPDC002721]|uniref:TetR/AcrR family transcriptional regulator n=1 Tax=Streptosporangium sp. NPDC002721 TaxID=3366188 RepID=UPI003677B258